MEKYNDDVTYNPTNFSYFSVNFKPFIQILIEFLLAEKDETNHFHGGYKAHSKSTSSSAIAKSDHLMKLNLDIGSMVEVG